MTNDLPFVVLWIEYSHMKLGISVDKCFPSLSLFTIVNTNLVDICQVIVGHMTVKTIDASNNEIKTIVADCFANNVHLKIIKLNNNRISFVSSNAFYNLPNLLYVDLSHNLFQHLPRDFIIGSLKLLLFVLQTNHVILRN